YTTLFLSRLDAGFVHVGGVVVGDPARVAAGGGVGLLQPLHQVGQALLGLFEHGVEHAGAGAVGRDLGGLLPAAVGVGVEVVARGDGLVDGGKIDARRRFGGGRGGCRSLGSGARVGGGPVAGGQRGAGEGAQQGQGERGAADGGVHAKSGPGGNTGISCADRRAR